MRWTSDSVSLDSVTGTFDVIYIAPAWMEAAAQEGRCLPRALAEVAARLAPHGCIVVKFPVGLAGNPRRTLVRLLSGQRLPIRVGNTRGTPVVSVQDALIEAGLRMRGDYYAIGSGPAEAIKIAVDRSLSSTRLAEQVFGTGTTFMARLRRLPLQAWIALGFSADSAFPYGLVIACHGASAASSSEAASIEWLKRTGRMVTGVVHRGGARSFVRCSPHGVPDREARLLEYLATYPAVRPYVNPAEDTEYWSGMRVSRYAFLPGHAVSHRHASTHGDFVRRFLGVLSTVSPPTFLEPAASRLNRYLMRRKPDTDSLLVDEAVSVLTRLDERGVLRWITHGELAAHNLRVVRTPSGERIKVIDWPQAYIGHPLLDWWMYNYWRGAPRPRGHTPGDLRMGVPEADLDDLWLLWRVAYGR
jgi:hypothetical protein